MSVGFFGLGKGIKSRLLKYVAAVTSCKHALARVFLSFRGTRDPIAISYRAYSFILKIINITCSRVCNSSAVGMTKKPQSIPYSHKGHGGGAARKRPNRCHCNPDNYREKQSPVRSYRDVYFITTMVS